MVAALAADSPRGQFGVGLVPAGPPELGQHDSSVIRPIVKTNEAISERESDGAELIASRTRK